MKKWFYAFIAILLTITIYPFPAHVDAKQNEHDLELWNAIKPLETTVTFLNTGAHPDDERSDFLAYLSRGLGVKTSSLIANRGEGGQNEIGQELGNALGIIRTREMEEASKITGVKAYHLSETTDDPIYDFGFSKTPEETLEKWGEEVVYERFIRFIRIHRPDIVMPSFRNVDTQHGHHRAITVLTLKAFDDAANPNVFPEHRKEGIQPWQIKKIYLPAETEEQTTTSLEIGYVDPIYGITYPQLGEKSRYLHKSQGMGKDIPAEPRKIHLELVHSIEGEKEKDQLFAGIPYNFHDWANQLPQKEKSLKLQLQKLQKHLEEIVSAYPQHRAILEKTERTLKWLPKVEKQITKAKLSDEMKNDLLHKLSLKKEQLETVCFVASQLEVKTSISTSILTKGNETEVKVQVKNNGTKSVNKVTARLITSEKWEVVEDVKETLLKRGKKKTWTFKVKAPPDAPYYHAYNQPPIKLQLAYAPHHMVVQHTIDLDETVALLPELGLTVQPDSLILNTADMKEEIPVKVNVKKFKQGKTKVNVSLQVPEGWRVEPAHAEVSFHSQEDEEQLQFTVYPPVNVEEGEFALQAFAMMDGKKLSDTVQEITYDHIGTSYYLYPATAKVVSFDLQVPKHLRIGYVDSGYDRVAEHLSEAGFNITKLTDSDLTSADLSQFDTIVVGIRGYLAREQLKNNNDRLLAYVKNGGHVVMQYHKPSDQWDADKTAPYKLEIGTPSIRWRVTDEEAKVHVLQPKHPLFHYPNEITNKDWDGWVQERGLYFPMEWDDRFETFVSMADPNEEPFTSGMLMAPYGEGTYLYTNLVWYRQIQNQVPGGYRIFTNLMSYPLFK